MRIELKLVNGKWGIGVGRVGSWQLVVFFFWPGLMVLRELESINEESSHYAGDWGETIKH